MKRLSVKPKNWLLSLHVAAGGIWLGTAVCLVLVSIVIISATKPWGRRLLNDSRQQSNS